MFYIYQTIIWLIFLLFLSSKIKRKDRRILFSIVASLFSTLEIVAVYMTESFIDYRFYNHMNLNAVQGHGFQFLTQMMSFTALFILISLIFYYISKKMNASILRHNKYFIPAVLTSFVLLSLPNGIFNETYKIYEILDAEEKDFNQALTDVGISPTKYITPNQLTAKKGKNIIVISIESLEQGFLGKDFDNITPNLSRLSKEWTFYNKMPQSPGGGWTAASLYNYQVGMPAFFKGQGNDFFQGTTDVKLTGLGNILNKAGYNSKYIVGNAEFAGMSDVLNAYNIPTISQDNALGKYPKVKNGFNDYDLFEEAKLQIKEFQKDDDKPFALFLSTVNTHFPKGIYDKRMEKFISKKDNNLEFSASAVDYLVNDLLLYLKKNSLLENTAIYIFPDHKLMGSSGPVHDKLRKSIRQLYLLTNVQENKLSKYTSDTIYQIDLPRMIVDGAEIKSNATFLVDFIENRNIDSFLKKNRVKLTTLNTASVAKKDYMQGIDISVIDNKLTIQSHSNNKRIDISTNEEVFDFTFNPELILIGQRKININNAFNLHKYDQQHKRLHLIVFLKKGKVYKTYFGNKQMIGLYKEGEVINYSEENIKLIVESNNIAVTPTKKTQTQTPTFKYAPLIVSITSSEWTTSKKIISLVKAGGQEFGLSRGLNLLTVNHQGKFSVENYDTYGSQEAATNFLIKLESLIKNKNFFAIAAHDAIKNDYPGFKEKLSELNFKLLQTLNGRIAYIAYSDNSNTIKESSSQFSLSYTVRSFIKPLVEEIKFLKKQDYQNNIEANLYRKDTNRFIAHAGGQIDGHKYTNSLEALNLNYQKGFRLFELDIIKTSDNVYVSTHDWKHWAKITGHLGDLPPDRKTFKEQKIYKKYTSMDIIDINQWFRDHPDAILVTDKVNTPMDFSKKFIDKSRLMMELFTWDAVKEGISAKIKSPMPTGGILGQIKGDKISYLKKLGITDIASSRRIINRQKDLLSNIVDSGINIYAFHVHFDKGKDEKYVVCEEQDYFYGMYADKWDFNTTLDCLKR